MKICPYCGSEIPTNVKKCKFCGEWLVIQEKDKPKANFHFAAIIEGLIAIIIIIFMFNNSYSDAFMGVVLIAYIILHIYFAPTLIADKKRTQYTGAILAINLLLGVTVIAWVGCLVWSLALPDLSKNESKTSDKKKTSYIDTAINEVKSEMNKIKMRKEQQSNDPNMPNDIQNQWNWGAFWLNWIWGIANKSLGTFFVFIPFFGFIWMFVCGANGNEWAWKNKKWSNVEEFQKVQKIWAIIANILAILAFIVIITMCVLIKNTPNEINTDTQATYNSEYAQDSSDDSTIGEEYSRTYMFHGINISYNPALSKENEVRKAAKQCYEDGNTTEEDLNQCIGLKLRWF